MCTLGAAIVPGVGDDVRAIWRMLIDSRPLVNKALDELKAVETMTIRDTGGSDFGFVALSTQDIEAIAAFAPRFEGEREEYAGAKKASEALSRHMFKSGDALFRLNCKYGDTVIEPNKGLLAIVVDLRKEHGGVPVPVIVAPDGSQTAEVKVASEDGGFTVVSATPPGRTPMLKPGDPVLWVPKRYSKEIAKASPDKRHGWVGLIRARVNLPASFANPFQNVTRFDFQ
jgi:hypothetical protein